MAYKLVLRCNRKLNMSPRANSDTNKPVCTAPRITRLMMVSVLLKPVRERLSTHDKTTELMINESALKFTIVDHACYDDIGTRLKGQPAGYERIQWIKFGNPRTEV